VVAAFDSFGSRVRRQLIVDEAFETLETIETIETVETFETFDTLDTFETLEVFEALEVFEDVEVLELLEPWIGEPVGVLSVEEDLLA
jgi:hypothetical protein